MGIRTYAMSFMSRWQSAVLAALKGDGESDAALGPLGSEHPIMEASCDTCEVMEASAAAGHNPLDLVNDVSTGEIVSTCAKLYVGLAAAKIMGDTERARELESELQYSVCDPMWAKALFEFDRNDVQVPYRHYESIDDFVVPLEPVLDNRHHSSCRIAFVADWATGTRLADNVMRCIAEQRPDVVIHLGDVYYSGTREEMEDHFLSIARSHLPTETRLFALAGNHDLYAGGDGYYWLIDELGQPASYFCLRNDHWQILAVGAPPEIGNPMSSQAKPPDVDETEIAWHQHKIDTADGRKTIMLSHHQLFTASGSIGRTPDNRPLALNPVLYNAFGSRLSDIDMWLWGHEHNLAAFEPYAGLERGRCIGSGAIPVALMWEPYTPLADLALAEGFDAPPVMRPEVQLGHDGDHYHHAFCILDVVDAAGQMDYFQVAGVDGDAELIFTETL